MLIFHSKLLNYQRMNYFCHSQTTGQRVSTASSKDRPSDRRWSVVCSTLHGMGWSSISTRQPFKKYVTLISPLLVTSTYINHLLSQALWSTHLRRTWCWRKWSTRTAWIRWKCFWRATTSWKPKRWLSAEGFDVDLATWFLQNNGDGSINNGYSLRLRSNDLKYINMLLFDPLKVKNVQFMY